MRTSSLIGHAIEAYTEYRRDPSIPADAVMRRFFFNRKYLGSSDRRAIADLYFGVIKNWLRLEALVRDVFPAEDAAINDGVNEPRVVAAFLIAMEGRNPKEVFADLELIRPGVVTEGALSCFADRERETTRLLALSATERLATLYSEPLWFVEALTKEYDEATATAMLEVMNGEAPTTLRANTLLTTREALQERLAQEGIVTTPSMIASDALTLKKRVNIPSLAAFRNGELEVQDEASQLVAPLAGIRKTAIKVLDACSGAGGKTLHLAALMKNRGEIYATDVDDRKLEQLKERSRRSGAQNIRIVRSADRARMLGADKQGWFDLVLLDVPCTGTGTLRRNPGIKWLLTPQMLTELVEKQRTIIDSHADLVRPGGTLLYATCSLLHEEGEDQVSWLLEHHPDFVVEEQLRTHPELDGCDGFFAARLRKVSEASAVAAS